mmetsp:Transcript_26901/g.62478  ORF Transcript_26901/g.62478 Transcript_26901/m.62478 type:complete len:132 (+) Transcript_26901:35-430(+)
MFHVLSSQIRKLPATVQRRVAISVSPLREEAAAELAESAGFSGFAGFMFMKVKVPTMTSTAPIMHSMGGSLSLSSQQSPKKKTKAREAHFPISLTTELSFLTTRPESQEWDMLRNRATTAAQVQFRKKPPQ